jgi:hypothetical protein
MKELIKNIKAFFANIQVFSKAGTNLISPKEMLSSHSTDLSTLTSQRSTQISAKEGMDTCIGLFLPGRGAEQLVV